MDAFTLREMLNSTEMSRFLCNLGVSNLSGCEPARIVRPDVSVKDFDNAVRVFLYCVIFLVSVVGNGLIVAVLSRNRRMRTVTNLFLLSLAVSDLMVALVCIPFTLISNLMRTFIFSNGTCKMVMYFMGVSVSVSTYNMVAIALERYSAICRPLSSKTWQTKSHALKVISATWLTSLSLMLPYIASSSLKPFNRRDNTVGYMCRMMWQNQNLLAYWYTSLLLLLFFLPGAVILTAYGLISVELYKGIRFELSNRTSAKDRPASFSSLRTSDSDGCYLHLKKRFTAHGKGNAGNAATTVGRLGIRSNTANLLAKKRVVRMLLVIVCLFFVCWTPIFVVNAWQAYDPRSRRAPWTFGTRSSRRNGTRGPRRALCTGAKRGGGRSATKSIRRSASKGWRGATCRSPSNSSRRAFRRVPSRSPNRCPSRTMRTQLRRSAIRSWSCTSLRTLSSKSSRTRTRTPSKTKVKGLSAPSPRTSASPAFARCYRRNWSEVDFGELVGCHICTLDCGKMVPSSVNMYFKAGKSSKNIVQHQSSFRSSTGHNILQHSPSIYTHYTCTTIGTNEKGWY
ncbi:cholecystokinin receptor type A isoform X1 [Phyllopteryx taeniolatus]|uniref:cholecystokinin receptor type A isoform X1 n=1 Tax=Phyllopteryx taeniolatus TaxID=161469 RepID=UPI002AD3C041|nr:cholecystokinin receptor type A isoform X1 [Phyllopteryx taeniolatus]